MKYILLMLMIFNVGCVTMNGDKSLKRYYCTRNFVQQKVTFDKAAPWCSKNFKHDLEE
jgi:hypothetical protein